MVQRQHCFCFELLIKTSVISPRILASWYKSKDLKLILPCSYRYTWTLFYAFTWLCYSMMSSYQMFFQIENETLNYCLIMEI